MTTEAEIIADLAVKAATGPILVKSEKGREFLVLPEGLTSRDVTEPNALPNILPDHIEQGVTLQAVDSLVNYANRFKTDTAVLFADIGANSIRAVLDYHDTAAAGHGAHVANMALPFSEEWQTWRSMDGKLLEQLEFARFLEENAADIVSPSGADLLEACRDLQAVRKVDFRKAVRTNSDNESFEYSDDTEAKSRATGKSVEVPSKFDLALPVYFGGEVTALSAFLRWKLEDGNLRLGIKLHRAEHVRQAVFKKIVGDVEARIERPAVFGKLG